MKLLILFDIDYTLLNTDSYKDRLYGSLAREIGVPEEQAYDVCDKTRILVKKTKGYFSAEDFLQNLLALSIRKTTLEALRSVFYDTKLYMEHLYEDSEKTIEALSRNPLIELGVLSTGTDEQQRRKIHSLKKYFHDDNIHIFSDKTLELENIANKYKQYRLYIVDDLPKVLAKAKQVDPNIITIQVVKDRVHEFPEDVKDFTPDHTVNNIRDIIGIIHNSFR